MYLNAGKKQLCRVQQYERSKITYGNLVVAWYWIVTEELVAPIGSCCIDCLLLSSLSKEGIIWLASCPKLFEAC